MDNNIKLFIKDGYQNYLETAFDFIRGYYDIILSIEEELDIDIDNKLLFCYYKS